MIAAHAHGHAQLRLVRPPATDPRRRWEEPAEPNGALVLVAARVPHLVAR
ncbi:hypothetical protein ACFXPV_32645 [Streptomyces sp. NPDC059118]